ncbi:hypothetical protein BKA81DRAFT_353617 [Phyllosticta paracitricarpa]
MHITNSGSPVCCGKRAESQLNPQQSQCLMDIFAQVGLGLVFVLLFNASFVKLRLKSFSCNFLFSDYFHFQGLVENFSFGSTDTPSLGWSNSFCNDRGWVEFYLWVNSRKRLSPCPNFFQSRTVQLLKGDATKTASRALNWRRLGGTSIENLALGGPESRPAAEPFALIASAEG